MVIVQRQGMGDFNQPYSIGAAIKWEKSLFDPVEVPEQTLRWMAVKRAEIERCMPQGTEKVVVSLKDLTDEEFNRLTATGDRPDSPPVVLSGSSRDMYRLLRSNPPRFPVYSIPKISFGESLPGGDIAIEGMANEVDLDANKFDPGSKVMLLWSMMGVIHGVRVPILGFIRESRDNGLLYSIEPKTKSLGEHIASTYGEQFGQEHQEHMGGKLADLFVRTANKNIIPRGACRMDTICVSDTEDLYFKGGVIFQAVEKPQEAMNFLLFNLGRTHFRDLEKAGFFPPVMQSAFLDGVDKSGLLGPGSAGDSGMPGFIQWEKAHKGTGLPPTKPAG